MSYKLFTDRNEDFECEVAVKNASLKGSMARLVVESDEGLNLIFKGKLNNGKCVIPVKRLKGLLEESSRGKMHLEVIVEDTYFKPWESDFIVEEHTSVKVKVEEQKQISSKPIVEVRVPVATPTPKPTPKKRGINIYTPINEIVTICKMFGLEKENIKERQEDFLSILKEYFSANPEYKNHQKIIINGIGSFMK